MTPEINTEFTNLRYVTIDSVYPQYLGMTLCMGMDDVSLALSVTGSSVGSMLHNLWLIDGMLMVRSVCILLKGGKEGMTHGNL